VGIPGEGGTREACGNWETLPLMGKPWRRAVHEGVPDS
jgi:hypothetical protein